MSRIGKKPIQIPEKVSVDYNSKPNVLVKGPKGEINFQLHPLVDIEVEESVLSVKADYENDSTAKAMMGTTQAILQNMVTGVSNGFTKQLNLVGVGYRASVSGRTLNMNLGFSHPIEFLLPEEVNARVQANTQIILESCDKQVLGEICAKIRQLRPPEPYKGKGILFENEVIRRKAGKTGKK